MANTLEHIRQAESRTLGVSTKRISVILQNQNAISNGFVSLIPRRSEFYTMPPQNYNFTGTTEWLDQLASHEYRHVVQFDKANRGFNKLLYYAFGPATLAAMSVTAVPQWFWEGDAVVTETAFTSGGRGKVPNFGLVFRTNLLEGREFNYHKQYLRSYKHNIPDHYVFGYHMVSYLRRRTGDPFIWEKVTKRAWGVPFIPFTFSNAIKKESGLYVTKLYNEMADELAREWLEEVSALQLSAFETVPHNPRKGYTNYFYPQVLDEDRILAMKSGIGDIAQLVILENGTEKNSFIPGILNDAGMLSAVGDLVVWNEYGFDPRWRMRTYSVIKLYDVREKKLKFVTRKSRYAGAALSPDQQKIVTVETNTTYNTTLTVLDTAGNVRKQLANPQQAFYSMPRWSADGKSIAVLKTTAAGRAVVVFDFDSGAEGELIAASNENIGHPVLQGDYLFYNSPVSGIDNIYVLVVSTGERFQVTSSKYGAYNPSLSTDGKTLYYNEQTRDGFDVVKMPVDPTAWREVIVKKDPKSFFQVITEQEGRPNLFDSIPQQPYATRKYSKLSGLFNPYSWGAYFNTGLTQADIGISSQDILSTTTLKAGYLYDINERTGLWRVGMSYQGFFPILDVDVTFGTRELDEGLVAYDKIETDTVRVIENLTYNWQERNLEAGFRLPLITTNSRYHGNFTIGNYFGYTRVEDFTNSITGEGRIITPELPYYWIRSVPGNGTLRYNHFHMAAYRLLKQSRRDINSKWGQSFVLHGYGTPYGGDYRGAQFSFYTTLYFPGLFKHHSFWGYWGYQKTRIELLSRTSTSNPFEDNGSYIFRNQIPLPRGLPISRFEDFYTMSGNYTFPVWYPDIAIGPLVNFQRIRANAFVDYGFGSSTFPGRDPISQTYLSVGGEVRLDLNVMRLLNQFNIGFRYSYGIQPSATRFEFLLGTINF
ncbi:MAG: PD40 domain-containing protein [Cyclobacteriaceae bacterium]|nr:PD40 domain-containing protein [Cyclobacteriaceae bacterium]